MAAAERIEAMGFSSLWGNDHLMPILGDADRVQPMVKLAISGT